MEQMTVPAQPAPLAGVGAVRGAIIIIPTLP